MSQPYQNPFAQQLQLLMLGYGYNFYDKKNQARADDLLVRQRAAKPLYEAGEAIARLEGQYQSRYIPPATRENPYPPVEAMNRLRDLAGLRDRIRDLGAKITGMPVPTQDKIWMRVRQELSLLHQLIQLDCQMVQQTEQIFQHASYLTPDIWHTGAEQSRFDGELRYLESLIRNRQQFLQMPV